MSLSQMQSALALIVRYPAALAGEELDAFLAQFDLSPAERRSLLQLAANRELGKFGAGIKDMRWEIITVRMPLVRKSVSDEVLYDIFSEGFDPVSAGVPNRELPHAYLSFLEEDEQARALIDRCAKPYVWDFIAFEKAQVQIARDRWSGVPAPAPSSPLATREIYPCEFRFDLPSYLIALEAARAGEPVSEPAPGDTPALLVPSDEAPGYRLFVLDAATSAFLKAALAGETARLPESYSALVEAGICKPLVWERDVARA